jgi:hypothetical protein
MAFNMKQTLTFAFYYANKGNILDRLIGFFTGSNFSHVEVLLPNRESWSSSPRDGGVRAKHIDYKPEKWHLVEIQISQIELNNLRRFFLRREGLKYDWVNIFLHPLRINSDERYTCTELISEGVSAFTSILDNQRHCLTPQELYEQIIEQCTERAES